MPEDKLMPFKVVKTPKICDNRGEYVKRGDTAYLNKATAEHYHSLGYIQVSMSGVFDEQAEPTGAKSSSETGSVDEGEAGADASTDAGEDQAQETTGYSPKPRRRRASS